MNKRNNKETFCVDTPKLVSTQMDCFPFSPGFVSLAIKIWVQLIRKRWAIAGWCVHSFWAFSWNATIQENKNKSKQSSVIRRGWCRCRDYFDSTDRHRNTCDLCKRSAGVCTSDYSGVVSLPDYSHPRRPLDPYACHWETDWGDRVVQPSWYDAYRPHALRSASSKTLPLA